MEEKEKFNQTLMPEIADHLNDSPGLDKLLKHNILKDISLDLSGLGIVFLSMTYPDGKLYFISDFSGDRRVTELVAKFPGIVDSYDKTLTIDDMIIRISPVIHDFEIIGYLIAGMKKEVSDNVETLFHMGNLLLKIVNFYISSTYKMNLTSSIHTLVVEDTYEELQRQNDLLKKSEKQYQELVKSLDEEVRKKAEEIKDANTQLMHQDKMASIGQLAAGVAHEINNPVGFVKSNLSTMNEYCAEFTKLIKGYRQFIHDFYATSISKDQNKALENEFEEIKQMEQTIDPDYLMEDSMDLIKESIEGTERIKKIVSDLKDFAHPGEDTPTHANINECIDSTLNIIWNELKYKVTLVKEYGNLPMLYCYPRQLNQVFMNICINAAHAIEKKGEIKIITKAYENHQEILISDTGSGISEEHISRIFDPFFTTKDVGKGTGLGLNLSYNIVKKHMGDIRVESRLNKGTTFIIKLPYENHL
ncbi:MAG: hypothetical protein KJ737_28185 [Proteobacteria bacterium]|nr:hypothetical protein [Pseudomonadota bacterium]